eukprot:COSAG06_NODE_53295_length_301_cov_0.366337_1_plen_21_part_01
MAEGSGEVAAVAVGAAVALEE